MEKIDFIAVVGTLLQLLVKSQAIKNCLYSIIGFLPDRAAGIQAKVDKKMDDDDDNNDQWDRDDEEDGCTEMMRRMRMSWRGITSQTRWDRVVHLSNLSPSRRHV